MVEKGDRHSINVTLDQHEAIISLKRGGDTVYDVVDRLLVPKGVESLELETHKLQCNLAVVNTLVSEIRKEMEKCSKKL